MASKKSKSKGGIRQFSLARLSTLQKIMLALGGTGVLLLLTTKAKGSPAGKNCQSYLGQSGLPRGIRNNNPGNIKYSAGNNWLGRVPLEQNTDKVFEQFTCYVYGVRAMIILLRDTYIKKWGLNTVAKIVNKYAPSGDKNNPLAYATTVASFFGWDINQVITADKETIRKLVMAMAYFENGRSAVDDATFDAAWDIS
jgi:hypothetical protein